MSRRAARARPGIRAASARTSRNRRGRRRPRRASRSACRCNGSTGRNLDFRGFAGTIASGSVAARRRDRRAAIRAKHARQDDHSSPAASSSSAEAGDAVTVTLADEIDIARGDMLAAPARPAAGRRPVRRASGLDVATTRCCPGRSYLMKIGTRTVPATVTELKHRIDVNTLSKLAAKTLELNEVGVCNLSRGAAARLRSLCREPRHRRLHPDRSLSPTRRSPPA